MIEVGQQETIYLNAGKQAKPVTVRRLTDRSLSLSFSYSKFLVEEVKASLKGATWHPAVGCKNCSGACRAPKSWTVTDCPRTRIQLDLLQGKLPRELERYEQPLLDAKPFRSLWDHQLAMFRHGITRRGAIFAAEPGTGKTLSAIEVMEWAVEHGFPNWWWVCPKNVQKSTELEFAKWGVRYRPQMVHYDILATELEAQFRCVVCVAKGRAEDLPESYTVDDEGRKRCPVCVKWKRCRRCGVEWKNGHAREPYLRCTACGEESSERRTLDESGRRRCPSCAEWKRCRRCGGMWKDGHKRCGEDASDVVLSDSFERARDGCGEDESEMLWHAVFERLPDRPAPHGVVFDESAFLMSGGARRSKAAQLLADAIREEHDGFVIEMSGIPAPHDPCGWHSQAEIARPAFLRESTVGHLRKRLAVIETVQGPEHAFPKIVRWRRDEVELLKRRLDGLVQVHLARDCQDLPELRKEIVKLEPSPEARRAAKLVAATSLSAVEALNKLRQLSDGFQYRGENEEAARAETPKDGALRELLGRSEEVGRVIVYAGFHESVDRCVAICREEGWVVARCDGRGWELEGVPEGWDETRALIELDRGTDTGEVEKLAFVGHPKTGGIGLNLTACPFSIYFSLDFDYGTLGQSLKRGHRAGMDKEKGFTAFFLCHLPTDEYVLKNLENKREMQSWTLEEVQAVLA